MKLETNTINKLIGHKIALNSLMMLRSHHIHKLMKELIDVKAIAKPSEILLTVDAMTGQDAANICKSFHDQLNATGVILTKLDGDTRGGAALSIKEVSGIPIKFASNGEQMDTFEVFHPERMASRILGMGDVLTLIEKATESIDETEAMGMMEKLMSDTFNYNDLLKQFKMIKRMGSVSKIMGFIPGMGQLKNAASQVDDKQFEQMGVLIHSMTDAERKDPKLIDMSSKKRDRVARGSGMKVADLNRLRQALETQKKMMKKMMSMDEKELEGLSKNPSKMMQPTKTKKGKGKGKDNNNKSPNILRSDNLSLGLGRNEIILGLLALGNHWLSNLLPQFGRTKNVKFVIGSQRAL